MAHKELPVDVRFARSYAVAESGCWEWSANVGNHGYGRISDRGEDGKWRMVSAHRKSYELHTGPIPHGMLVLHSCDNRKCVNPAHLRLGSYADNTADMMSRERQARGERKTRQAKLSEESVRWLRKQIAGGAGLGRVARDLGVSKSTVCMANSGKRWAHV